MKKLFIEDIVNKVGEVVTVCGWAHRIRDHKKVVFIDLRDRSGDVQMVGDRSLSSIAPEDVVCVIGLVKERPAHMVNEKSKTGMIEIECKGFTVLSKAHTLPFDFAKDQLDVTLPVLLDYRALTLRHPKIKAIFKVQETVINSFREYLSTEKFIEFQSPILIPETAEGGAEVFEVGYFNYKAYLSQSPQFYKQIMVPVFEKVFTVNKTLRAEPSVTTRHLTEVTTLDAEMGFIDDWTELMDQAEGTIRAINNAVDSICRDELELYGAGPFHIPDKIPRIKLRDAQEIIGKRLGRDISSEPDLSPDGEREIAGWAREEHKSDLVFITHYPVNKRPFYTMEDPADSGYTLSFDLIGRGVELLTGGQRIHDYGTLVGNAKKRGINLEKSALYLQAFKYGMPPEGGFSFGSERIVMQILHLANIREASLFPRDMERIDIRLKTVDNETKEKSNQG